jgi:DNA-binding NarL/FixJ family response regulator
VVVVSQHPNGGHSVHAMRAGATAYVLKDSAGEELDHALREAAAGRTYISPGVKHARAGSTTFESLTPRQREVLLLIASGSNTKEIAAELEISVKTVETHRAHLMSQLGIHDVAGLVRYAIRVGVTE